MQLNFVEKCAYKQYKENSFKKSFVVFICQLDCKTLANSLNIFRLQQKVVIISCFFHLVTVNSDSFVSLLDTVIIKH